MDLGSLMDPAPFTVQPETPLPKVVHLFCSMGLRHLPVVNCDGQVTGANAETRGRGESIVYRGETRVYVHIY